MDFVEKEALSVPEAVFAAARVLGIEEKDAQVQVLSAGGARRVKVRVGKPGVQMPPVDAPPAQSERQEARPERTERAERPEREERHERAPREERRDRQAGDSQAPMVQRQAPNADQATRAQADL